MGSNPLSFVHRKMVVGKPDLFAIGGKVGVQSGTGGRHETDPVNRAQGYLSEAELQATGPQSTSS
jgi:hypothetical protein